MDPWPLPPESENEDLLWALRGAGANFGIVTSATLRAYPTQVGGRYWAGELVFEGDKLEDFVTAMNDLHFNTNMTVHWGFYRRRPGEPVITAEIFWMAPDPEDGRDAFASLYALEPIEDTTQVVMYLSPLHASPRLVRVRPKASLRFPPPLARGPP